MAANYTSHPRPPLRELLTHLLEPWQFMALSLSYLPGTITPLLKSHSLRTLLSFQSLQPLWFARFWSYVGPQVRTASGPRVTPLLSGLVSGGTILTSSTDSTTPGIGGVILEIGPGSGMMVSLLSPPKDSKDQDQPASSAGHRSRITHIYGVEPNPSVHAALRSEIAAAGLQETYEIVPLGIQDALATGRIPEASVDCIVSILCLCSIPDPAENIAQIYRTLKPGGRWYVYEHVRAFREQGWGMNLYQAFVNLFWPHCIGGCNIRRDTLSHLKAAGPWSKFDLVQPPQEPWYFTLPHVYGILTK